MKTNPRAIILTIVVVFSLLGCQKKEHENLDRDLQSIKHRGKMRVITLYGPISYFNYKDNVLGYEYEFAKELCDELGVEMEVIVAPNLNTMVEALENGEADLIAYRVPRTNELKKRIEFTKKEYITRQVIIQSKSDSMITDVLQLAGKQVYVTNGSIYQDRLKDLNNEIGGGINIITVPDSVSEDDLIAQTALHKISFTVADNDLARLNKTYFSDIDYGLAVSFPQRSAWAVRKDCPELLAYINKWSKQSSRKTFFSTIYYKYFERTKYFESQGYAEKKLPKNRISSFDDYFKRYAKIAGWDWRLVAAVAYNESKFDPNIVSWAGASGLMQLMPSTARHFGLSEIDFRNPELSIKAGAKYIKYLNDVFSDIKSQQERTKFVLASYNSGPAHISDARALAIKYKKNPNVWDNNVETYIRLKSNPEYYNDEVCKHGYFRGNETADYVDLVLQKYELYKLWVKK